ncbi:MAG: polysaccharide lyase [Verrucomicrobiales bacterium]|nr:polysaccharide lyase [Verrucomicrobiales bacterium]
MRPETKGYPGLLFAGLLAVSICATAFAQYPRISSEIATESNRRMRAADARSDAAWSRAQPAIREWAAKGKPYIPDADEPDDLPQALIPAFPGAQGGGMYSHGGRGGRVFVVTNLNDDGPGSLREACETGGPRIVVFNVAGIIRLKDRLRIRAPYITLSGATAPGDGVCIAGNTVEIETHDVIIRHLRFRRGSTWVGDRNDSLGGNAIGNIIIDHVSASWGLDENMSLYRHMYRPPDGGKELKLATVNITIQNSIFSEALNTYHHAFGSTIGGYNATFHHNLWACNTGRNPSVGMIYDFTFANNVVFNWRHRTVDGGDHRSFYTIINNYFKPGPVTPANAAIRHRILKPESRRAKPPVDDYGLAYVAGNIVEGNARVTVDNWDGGVQPEPLGDRDAILAAIRAERPYPHAHLEVQSAAEAWEYVLANAGATLPRRDAVDRRLIEMVRTGKVTAQAAPDTAHALAGVGFSDALITQLVHEVSLGIITDPEQVGGYPEYRGTPYPDADHDGLPDTWEIRHGLDPHDPADANADRNGDGYTHVEEFLYGLDPTAPKQTWPSPRTYLDLWKTDPALRPRLDR